jgi:hypothetical protein
MDMSGHAAARPDECVERPWRKHGVMPV